MTSTEEIGEATPRAEATDRLLEPPEIIRKRLTRLRVRDIQMPRYQRHISEALVKEIVDNFNPLYFEELRVNERPGEGVFCIDGQHRLVAMIRRGREDDLVDCIVYRGLSFADEVDLYKETQRPGRRKPLTAGNIMKADIAAGDRDAVAIEQVVEEFGLFIDFDHVHPKDPRAIRAVAGLRTIFSEGREMHLRRVLHVLSEAWTGKVWTQQSIMLGLHSFLLEYEGMIDDRKLVKQLRNESPRGLVSRAVAASGVLQGGRRTYVAQMMLDLYNAGRGGAKLPPWGTRRRSGPVEVTVRKGR